MKKYSCILGGGIIAILIILFFYYLFYFSFYKKAQICFPKTCFLAELALTQKEQEKGLMFRKNLPSQKGMLFVFKREDIYPFWMKNTFIPLDIIWIDKNYKVVFIKYSAKPCQKEACSLIVPEKRAKYVLEIKAGLAKKFNIELDQKAVIRFIR
jgi:hypothetical protein